MSYRNLKAGVVGLLVTLAAGCETPTQEFQAAGVKVLDLTAAGATVTGLGIGLRVGQTLQLYASPKDASGNPVPDAVVTWAASPPTVATVSANGLVTGVAVGTATISATSGTVTASLTLAVINTPVFSVTVTPAVASVVVGQGVQLAAAVRDSLGNVLMGRKVAWTSSAPAAASVDTAGLVRGIAAGAAIVTATSDGKSGTASVTVTATPPPPPPPSGVLFADSFETGGCGCWAPSAGTWSVVTDASGKNHVYRQGTVGSSFTVVQAPAGSTWGDYAVQVSVTPLSWGSSDATVRLSGRVQPGSSGSFYTASLEQGAVRLRRFTGGSITDVVAAKAYTVRAGTTYRVRLAMVGPALSVYVNDTLQLTGRDTLYKTGGIALGGWNTTSTWDNVQVASLSSTTISGVIVAPQVATMKVTDSLLICVFFRFETGQVGIGTYDHPTCDALYAGLKLTAAQAAVSAAQQAVVDSACVDAVVDKGTLTGPIASSCAALAASERRRLRAGLLWQVALRGEAGT